MIEILKGRREAASDGAIFVFENRPGSGSVAHRGKKAASVLCRSLTFEFRAHDLQRTAATRMAEAGIPRDHIAKVLNHVEGGPAATRVYDRYNYDAEKRDALDRWARGLAAVIEGKTKKWSLSVHDEHERFREAVWAMARRRLRLTRGVDDCQGRRLGAY